MSCNSEYLNPTRKEQVLQETAQLYGYVLRKLNKKVPQQVISCGKDQYCSVDFVATLCATLKKLSAEQLESIIYDAHSAESRRLANWWEEHQAADKKRTA